VIDFIKDFFSQDQNFQSATLSNSNELLLAKATLENSDIGFSSALLSTELPNEKTLEVLGKILNLKSDESSENIFPDAKHWSITQDGKSNLMTEIETNLEGNVRSSIAQKILYCSEELLSNAIYAQDPKLKAKAAKLAEQKSVDTFLVLHADVKVLVVKDYYGTINQTAKSQILANITKEVVSPRANRDEGGAGIGLNLVREFCDFLIIRHSAGNWTESYCFFFKQRNTQAPFLFSEVH
jgi:hypothetical protein